MQRRKIPGELYFRFVASVPSILRYGFSAVLVLDFIALIGILAIAVLVFFSPTSLADPSVDIELLSLLLAVGLLIWAFRRTASSWLKSTLRESNPNILEPGDIHRRDWSLLGKKRSDVPDYIANRSPPYSFDIKRTGELDRQTAIWWIPTAPTDIAYTRILVNPEWWNRFSKELAATTDSGKELSRQLSRIRQQVRLELVSEPLQVGKRPGDTRLELVARPIKIETDSRALRISLGPVSYSDRILTCFQATRKLAAQPAERVESLFRRADDILKVNPYGPSEDVRRMPLWNRSVAVHSSVLLFTCNLEPVLAFRGNRFGEGELTLTAGGAIAYLSLFLEKASRIFRRQDGFDGPRASVARELREEIGVRVRDEQLGFLGVATYPTVVGCDPEFLYVARTSLDFEGIVDRWRWAQDKTEIDVLFKTTLSEVRGLAELWGIPEWINLAPQSVRPTFDLSRPLNPPLIAALHLLGRTLKGSDIESILRPRTPRGPVIERASPTSTQ